MILIQHRGQRAVKHVPSPPTTPPPTVVWQPRMWNFTVAKEDWVGGGSLFDAPGGSAGKLWEDYGIEALRVASTTSETILGSSWRRYFYGPTRIDGSASSIQSVAPIYEAWALYGIVVDPDVVAGFTSGGTKLPGFSCKEPTQTDPVWSLRMWHATPSGGNVELRGYFFGESWNPNGNETVQPFTGPPLFLLGSVAWVRNHLKLNSIVGGVPQADGVLQVWLNNTLVYDRSDLIIRETDQIGGFHNGDLNHFWGNIFHGGPTGPSQPIHYEFGGIQVSFTSLPDIPTLITLNFNLNNSSWGSNPAWNQTGANGAAQRQMHFSSVILNPHTKEDLEFCREQDSVPAGDNTGVRYQRFDANGLAGGGYYWPNNDTNITETDNFPVLFLPDKKWCWHPTFKIISLDGTPSAIFRNTDGQGKNFYTDFHDMQEGSGISATNYKSNYNPAICNNPGVSDAFQYYFGGGHQSSFRGAANPVMKIVKSNPNYPATSTKPLIFKAWAYSNTIDAPIMARNAPRVGTYAYWGGAIQQDSIGNQINDRTNRFYRINLTTLEAAFNTNSIPQERIADCPTTGSGYFSLLVADDVRRHLIYLNSEGVFRYLIDHDHWQGPFTFGQGANWATYISSGANSVQWLGFVGVHRSDLNATFFRFATSPSGYSSGKQWHRINWNNWDHNNYG